MKLSTLNKFSISIAFLLGVLCLYCNIMQQVYLTVFIIIPNNETIKHNLNVGYDIERKIVWPLADFFCATAILCLLYSLGMKKIRYEDRGKVSQISTHQTRSARG
jgi:hypothetical protein